MKIKSSWGKVFKNMGNPVTLFNNYPEVCQKAGAYDDDPLVMAYEITDEDYVPEVYQWYIVDLPECDIEWLQTISQGTLKFWYSDLLGLWIMPVYHCGTGWDCVGMELDMPEGTPVDLWESKEALC